MSSAYPKCPYCNRDNFESARGLTQHQNRSKPCNIAMQTPLDINEEISDYDSETDGSAHADNWDCVSVDSGDQLGGSADDASDSL